MSAAIAKLTQIHGLIAEGRAAQARGVALRLLQGAPGDPDANDAMAAVLEGLGEFSQAVFYSERAVKSAPGRAELRERLANLLLLTKRHDEALVQAQRAVELAPGAAPFRRLLSTVLSSLGRYSEAAEVCFIDGAIPEDPRLMVAAAGEMLRTARIEEALPLFERAAELAPRDVVVAGALAFAINYAPGVARENIFEAHRRYGKLVEPTPVRPAPVPTNADPERRLRVGLVSPDMHNSAAMRFLTPVLKHTDKSRLELVIYDTAWQGHADSMTALLKPMVSEWREIGVVSWERFAATVRGDRIDVLFDLSGHTTWHALPLFAHRPAPVQVTYLGYPNTTGLASIDYRIVDSMTDPSPWADALASERLLRLDPSFLCFEPHPETPEVSAPPFERNGFITFGSFNTAQKINRGLVKLWSEVLRRVPDSRLFLKAINFRDARLVESMLGRFEAHGIDRARLSISGPDAGAGGHLAKYAEVDIGLDTFPYHGTTTTGDAFMMGVPIVTLEGDCHLARVGISMLTNVGLADLIARSEGEYVEIAAALAADRARLKSIRAGLRRTLLVSPLGDGPAFARRFESVLRGAWREACGRAK